MICSHKLVLKSRIVLLEIFSVISVAIGAYVHQSKWFIIIKLIGSQNAVRSLAVIALITPLIPIVYNAVQHSSTKQKPRITVTKVLFLSFMSDSARFIVRRLKLAMTFLILISEGDIRLSVACSFISQFSFEQGQSVIVCERKL